MLPEAQALEGNVTPLRGTDIRLSGNSTLYLKSYVLLYLVPEENAGGPASLVTMLFFPTPVGLRRF